MTIFAAYMSDGSIVDSTRKDRTFSFTTGINSVLPDWEQVGRDIIG